MVKIIIIALIVGVGALLLLMPLRAFNAKRRYNVNAAWWIIYVILYAIAAISFMTADITILIGTLQLISKL